MPLTGRVLAPWPEGGRLSVVAILGGRNRRDEPEDHWVLAQGVLDGHPVIARTKRTNPDPGRPVKVTVRLGFVSPDERGWPGPADHDVLQEAENILLAELAQNGAEMVLVVTGNLTREFIAYGAAYEWLNTWGPTVLDRWGDGRPGTGLDAEMEPDWATYRFFADI
jgi:hypothetical protein